MIIGRGMIAQAFAQYKNNDDVIIFASGVSDSQETEPKEFQRELTLVKKILLQNPDKLFVYFSTCSMYDPAAIEAPYVQHKLFIERYIKQHTKYFLILRVSQILGKSNNSTLVNYLFDKIEKGERFDVWENSNRNLIAIQDVVKLSNKLIEKDEYYNKIYHLANSLFTTVPKLVILLEQVLQKEANYISLDRGESYNCIPNDIEKIVSELNIRFNEQYYFNHLKMFYESTEIKVKNDIQ